ncbi:DNA repair protein RadA [Chitinispirillales bacterium ANBcel5]|uniref:DNA repair protein RadA n=1 Tax=Cellulosispirillum alkaliphilum TaxID=3039283 RepID=UPI002A519D37|nr:DNA repair protein RadA [Chitinispirillales bacterium ANBcel5]
MKSKKIKTAYVCNSCGQDYSKWHGRCESCGLWDSITEIKVNKRVPSGGFSLSEQNSTVKLLSDCDSISHSRYKSSFSDIDMVLGGGLVEGGFVLLGGDPGIGKSTLLLQIMSCWAEDGKSVLYVTGEESAQQVALRARRLEVQNASIKVFAETNIESMIQTFQKQKPQIVVIDSIQTAFTETLESAPGSVSQIRECGAMLLRFAKTEQVSIILVGHVTKEGAIAGPRVLEHMVDTVLQFEGEGVYNYRILRAVKNRFGPAGEIAFFSMTDKGLKEERNASEFFMLKRERPQAGTSVTPLLEGSRVIAVELQALVNRSHFGLPQRVASGINQRKLSLLIAVMEKYGGLVLGDHDVFFNVAGGLSVHEPAADLGVVAALYSSFRNLPIKHDLAFIGELGLGGEVRSVNNMAIRLKELARMGFKECAVTKPVGKADWYEQCKSILSLIPCKTVSDIADIIC